MKFLANRISVFEALWCSCWMGDEVEIGRVNLCGINLWEMLGINTFVLITPTVFPMYPSFAKRFSILCRHKVQICFFLDCLFLEFQQNFKLRILNTSLIFMLHKHTKFPWIPNPTLHHASSPKPFNKTAVLLNCLLSRASDPLFVQVFFLYFLVKNANSIDNQWNFH